MTPNLTAVREMIEAAVPTVAPAAQLVVRWQDEPVLNQVTGYLDPETCQRPTTPETGFDLASVTKLFVVTTLMRLVEQGKVGLDQPVASVLPRFGGERAILPYEDPLQTGGFVTVALEGGTVDAGKITFRHLLTHTSGLPAWRPLFRQGSVAAAQTMALETACAYPTGTRIIYSDIGLILVGLAIEQLTGSRLDRVVAEQVTKPLGLTHTGYLPLDRERPVEENVAPTEHCAWRQRRIVGEVHDENAAGLGGVAGHAGLFSTAADVARFGQTFLDGGHPLLRPETVAEMVQQQAEDDDLRRGLGWVLWSADAEASGNPFSQHAFGHTGFTGTSLWIDPDRRLVVALLTNDVYGGRTGRGIMSLRVRLHRAIVAAIDAVQ